MQWEELFQRFMNIWNYLLLEQESHFIFETLDFHQQKYGIHVP